MTRARIPNWELDFLENNIALAIGIVQDAKALLYWINEPDAIHILSLIIEKANRIRHTHIQEMNGKKSQRVQSLAQELESDG